MVKRSAGLLLHRSSSAGPEVLLVHPGGPFWSKKDDGVWSVPKGEHGEEDDPLLTAVREFTEELGSPPPTGSDVDLGEVKLKSGKRVRCFAREGDFDPTNITSNTFEQEWPPRSGRTQAFPEVDRAEWFDFDTARRKLNPAQAEFVERLETHLEER